MSNNFKRREFLRVSGATLVAGAIAKGSPLPIQQAAAPKPRYKKTLKFGMVKEDLPLTDKFKLLNGI